jgi:hypothetical protein
MAQPVVDQWLLDSAGNPDPFAQNVDFGMTKDDEIDPDLSLDIHPGLDPEVVIVPGTPPAPVVPVTPEPPPAPVIEPEPEGPKVYQVEDGTITLEKEKGQWKLTVSNEIGGSPQTYWGKTKDELLVFGLGKAQLNSTKKIREQNLKLKFGPGPVRQVAAPAAPAVRDLSADEIFELKMSFESNPDQALETWFQKKTGRTLTDLANSAQKGEQAEANLETDSVCQIFLRRNPDYFGDDTNFDRIIQWIGKFKAGTAVPAGPAGMYKLYYAGHWTVENLEEAFTDLSNDNLLIRAPRPVASQPPPPVAVPHEPAPAPRPDERIVRTETRPRAALGIRQNDVTPVAAPETPTAPTDEDLNNLSDSALKQLLGGVRRLRQQARRS